MVLKDFFLTMGIISHTAKMFLFFYASYLSIRIWQYLWVVHWVTYKILYSEWQSQKSFTLSRCGTALKKYQFSVQGKCYSQAYKFLAHLRVSHLKVSF